MDLIALISQFFILFAVCSFWLFKNPKVCLIMLLLALGFGHLSSIIDSMALFTASIYLLACYTFYQIPPRSISRSFMSVIVFSMAWILIYNMLYGFKTLSIIQDEIVSGNGARYSLNLHFDKVIAGLGLLIFGVTPIRKFDDFKNMIKSMLPTTVMSIITVATLGIMLGVVQVDLKFPDVWIIWIPLSLLVNSVAEEVVFRFFLQGGISKTLEGSPIANIFAITISSLAFTMFHAPNSTSFLLSVFLAGLFFGYVYMRTKRIEAAILLHFITNSIHFFVFTYPFINA